MATESKDTLQSRATLTVLDLIGEGQIGGLVDGLKSVYINGTPLKNSDGTDNFKGLSNADMQYGENTQEVMTPYGNFTETPFRAGVQVKKEQPFTFTVSSSTADTARITMTFPALMVTDQNNGDTNGTTVQYRILRSVDNGPFTVINASNDYVSNTTWTVDGQYRVVDAPTGATGIRASVVVGVSAFDLVTGLNAMTISRNSEYSATVVAEEFNGTAWQQIGDPQTLRLFWHTYNGVNNAVSEVFWSHNSEQITDAAVYSDYLTIESNYPKVRFRVTNKTIASAQLIAGGAASRTSASTVTVTGKSRSRYQKAHLVQIPRPSTTVRFRVERVTDDSTSTYLNNETWVDSYSEIVTLNMSYPNTALFGLQIDSQQFNNIPARAYLVDGLLIQVPTNYDPKTRTYTGTWDGNFKRAVSNNPAWVLYDILTNTRYGLGNFIPATQVDKATLYTIGRYCDAVDESGNFVGVDDGYGNGGKEPRFTINTAISTQAEAYKLISDLTSVFRGMGYWDGGMVKFTQDSPANPVMLYGPSNVIDGQFSYTGSSRKDRHSVIHVTWNDPDDFYRKKIEYVEDADLIARYGIKKLDTLAFGCTSRGQAARVGKWILYTERYESDLVTFKVGLDAALVAPGDIIKIHDPTRTGKRLSGRLVSSTTTSAVLDAPITIEATPVMFSVMLADGTYVDRQITQGVGTHSTISWTDALPSLPVDNAVWLMTEAGNPPILARVLAVSQQDNPAQYEITAVENNPSKYGFIEQGLKLEDYDTSLLGAEFVETPRELSYQEMTYEAAPSVAGRKLAVSWFSNCAKFEFAWRANSEGNVTNWTTVTVDNATNYEILGVLPGTYEFSIVAINPLGKRSKSTTGSYVVQGALVPRPVLTLSATGLFRSIRLDWTFTADTITSHWELWHATTNNRAAATKLANIAFPTTSYTHAGLDANSQHYYWLRTVSVTGDTSDYFPSASGVNAQVATIPLLDPPTNITTSQTLSYVYQQPLITIGVAWDAIASAQRPYLSAYGVAYSFNGGASWIETETALSGWNLPNVIPNLAYQFKVRTKNTENAWGAYSGVVTFTPTGDLAAPSVPTGLTATTGTNFIRLSWTASPESDTAGYEVFYSKTNNSASAVSAGKTDLPNLVVGGLDAGTPYYLWVKAYDTSRNFSAFSNSLNVSTDASATTASPNAITGLTLAQSTQTEASGLILPALTATWTADPNAAYYEVSIKEGTGNFVASLVSTTSNSWRQLRAGVAYTVRVRGFNASGQFGGYSLEQSITMTADASAPSAPTAFTAVASLRNVYLSWTNPTATDLKSARIFTNSVNSTTSATVLATVEANSGQRGGYTHSGLNPNTQYYYWVRAVDASGNLSGFSSVATATTIQAAAADIAAGSITADKIVAGSISGDRISTATSLPGTITVGDTGVAIGTVQSQANNPAARINEQSTQIDPGKIVISGATTLADWRNGTDSTKIEGGNIAANTISANQLTVGLRGLNITGLQFSYDKTANTVSWTSGTVEYVGNTGSPVTATVSAGNAQWVANVIYIYWDQADGATLKTTTARASAYGPTKFVVATYDGGIKLIANYGRTLIDGDQIITGTVKAQSLETNVLSASNIKSGTIESALVYIGKDANSDNHLMLDGPNERILVNDGTRDRVKMGRLATGAYGIEIIDASGNVILTNDGRLGSSLYVGAGGQTLGEIATNAANPSTNYIGEFATAPSTTTNPINSVYRNTGDKNLYILKGAPPTWQLYLEKGADGVAGAPGRTVSIAASTGQFITPANGGTITPSTITLTATANNFTSPTYQWYTVASGAATLIAGATNASYTVNSFTSGQSFTYRCIVTDTGGATAQDQQTIASLKEGDDSLNAFLSNEAHSVSCDSSGNPKAGELAKATSKMTVFRGAAAVTSGITYSLGAVSGATAAVATDGTVTVSALSANTATITVNATIGSTTLGKVFTVTKSLDGATGASYWMTSSAPIIGKSPAGVLNPTSVTFSAYSASGTNAPAAYAGRFIIAFSTDGTAYTNAYTSSANESTVAYTVPSNAMTVRARLYLAGGTSTLIDEEVLQVVADGKDSLNIVLSNTAQSVPATSAGVVTSFTGAASTVSIYEGTTDVSSSWAVTKVDTNCTSTLSTRTATVTALSADSGYVTFTATRSGYPTLTARFTVTKSKAGTDGANGTNGTNGTNGERGSLTGYGQRYSISSSSWSDAQAQAVIYNMINGTTVTTYATTSHLRVGDTVTLSNNGSFAQTRYWGGTSWLQPGMVVDGNLLVTGTISGDKIAANSVTADKITNGAASITGVLPGTFALGDTTPTVVGNTYAVAKFTVNTANGWAFSAANTYTGSDGGWANGGFFATRAAAGVGMASYSISTQLSNFTGIRSVFIGGAHDGGSYGFMQKSGSFTITSGLKDDGSAASDNFATRYRRSAYTAATPNQGLSAHWYGDQATNLSYGGTTNLERSACILANASQAALMLYRGDNGLEQGRVTIVPANSPYAIYVEPGASYTSTSAYIPGGVAPFTGTHEGESDVALPVGDIVVDAEVLERKDISNVVFAVELSESENQRGVIGVVARCTDRQDGLARCEPSVPSAIEHGGQQVEMGGVSDSGAETEPWRKQFKVSVNALGEGQINVCGRGGNIERGDLIVASSIPGKGMKQSDDIIRSYTVAKARESVTFDSPDEVKMIACIYLAG